MGNSSPHGWRQVIPPAREFAPSCRLRITIGISRSWAERHSYDNPKNCGVVSHVQKKVRWLA